MQVYVGEILKEVRNLDAWYNFQTILLFFAFDFILNFFRVKKWTDVTTNDYKGLLFSSALLS